MYIIQLINIKIILTFFEYKFYEYKYNIYKSFY